MCATCIQPACDCTAIVFRQRSPLAEFSQAEAIELPGRYCAPAAWEKVFHELRTKGSDYIGGEVRMP